MTVEIVAAENKVLEVDEDTEKKFKNPTYTHK